jgi:hypothetical protein
MKRNIKKRDDNKLKKFIWLGAIYPWYDINSTITFFKNNKEYSLDMYNINHIRYSNLYDKNILNNLPDNISIINKYLSDEEKMEIYDMYDAGILLAKSDIEDKYTTRFRLYDMIQYGLPVITHYNNPIFKYINGDKKDFLIDNTAVLFPSI